MSNHFRRLCEEIIERSKANNFEDACKEWGVIRYRTCDHASLDCICGKKGIATLYLIQNTNNKNEVEVGSECVKKFQNTQLTQEMDFEKMFPFKFKGNYVVGDGEIKTFISIGVNAFTKKRKNSNETMLEYANKRFIEIEDVPWNKNGDDLTLSVRIEDTFDIGRYYMVKIERYEVIENKLVFHGSRVQIDTKDEWEKAFPMTLDVFYKSFAYGRHTFQIAGDNNKLLKERDVYEDGYETFYEYIKKTYTDEKIKNNLPIWEFRGRYYGKATLDNYGTQYMRGNRYKLEIYKYEVNNGYLNFYGKNKANYKRKLENPYYPVSSLRRTFNNF